MPDTQKTLKQIFDHFTTKLKVLYNEEEAYNITHWVFEEKLGLNRAQMVIEQNKTISGDEINSLEQAFHRLTKGEPVQYVLGTVHFLECRLNVEKSVLIPRPETEELASKIIHRHPGFRGKLLDIGTGSGCIAIALARHFPEAEVHGWENSREALEVAKINAHENNASVLWEEKNVLQQKTLENQFDLITCNPPYVLEGEKSNMGRNILGFEPPEALFVPDDDPLIYFRQVMQLAANDLNEQGWLYFEINERYASQIRAIFEDTGFKEVAIGKDLSNKERFAWGKKG